MTASGPLDDRLIKHLFEASTQRREQLAAALAAMEGRHPASLAIADSVDFNIVVNLPRLITDAQVHGMFGNAPEWEAENQAPADALEAWRDDPANAWDLRCQSLVENGAWSGIALLKVDTSTPGVVRLIPLDPLVWMPVHDPDDVEDTYAYVGRWRSLDARGARVWRRQIVERMPDESWQIRDQVSNEADQKFRDLAAPIRWEYEWSPVDHAQNLLAPSECWGRPDLTPDVIDVCYGVNRVLSNANKISFNWAHPKAVGFGFDSKQVVNWGPDEMPVIGNTDARVDILTTTADVASVTDFAKTLREALHMIARTPEVGSGKLEGVGQLSGVALTILYGPAEAILGQKRLTYGPLLMRAQNHVAEILGMGDPGAWTITWQDSTPRDVLGEAQAASVKVTSVGLSKQTALEELGYDADQEAERRDEEAATAMQHAQSLIAAGGDGSPIGQPVPPAAMTDATSARDSSRRPPSNSM